MSAVTTTVPVLPRLKFLAPHLHALELPSPGLDTRLLELDSLSPLAANAQIIAQAHAGLPSRLLDVFLQLLPCHHDGDRRLRDEIVGEGSQQNAFECGSTTTAKDDKCWVELVDLRVCQYGCGRKEDA